MNTGNVPIQNPIGLPSISTFPTLPPIVPADAPILPINSLHSSLPPSFPPAPRPSVPFSFHPSTRPLTYVPFGRMRHFMRDEVKKSGVALQFRKESVNAMKDVCDQFLHQLIKVAVDICTKREAAQRQAKLQVGPGGLQVGPKGASSGSAGGNKRRMSDETNEPNKRINTSRPSVPTSLLSSSSIPPVTSINYTNNVNNVNNANNNNVNTEKIPARLVIAELLATTQKQLHTVLPEDIEQALQVLKCDHLLLSDPRKDLQSEDEEEINELFLL